MRTPHRRGETRAKGSEAFTHKNVRCLYTNADSIHNKLPELETVAQNLKPDIIAISEVKPKFTRFKLQANEILMEGFQEPVHNLDMEGRGVCIYIRDGLNYKSRDCRHFSQMIVIEVESPTCEAVVVGVVYRSPNSTEEENAKLNIELTELFKDEGQSVLLLGDFNFPEIDWDSQSSRAGPGHRATRFLNTMQDTMTTQLVTEPTHRRPGQQPTLIDLVFINKPEEINSVTHAPSLGKSHHEVIIVDQQLTCLKGPEPPRPLKYAYQRADYSEMKRALQREDLSEKLKDVDCDQAWGVVKETLTRIRNKYVPSTRVRIGNNVRKKPLWMNDAALRKVRKKHSAYRRYLTTREGKDYLEYVRIRNEAQKEIQRSKRSFEYMIAKECKKNPKAFWNYYNDKTRKHQQLPTLTDEEGNSAECDREKADCLNDFFASVFTVEDTREVPTIPRRTVTKPMPDILITPEAVAKKLKKLNPSKAQGPDEIHPKLLQELSQELAEPLAIMFNKSLEAMKVPEDWKAAQVKPIFKKGNRTMPTNYRPVSLTSVLCKVMESLIKDHIMEHLMGNDFLDEHQHGFVPRKGCNTNLLESMEAWLNHLDKGSSVDIFFLDYSKAFDRVPHERLLSKLNSYAFIPRVVGWIKSFLESRTQFVTVNSVSSKPKKVISGVPQGSVLGPLLFVIYVNDLPGETTNDLQMFADDTKCYGEVDSVEREIVLQQDLNSLDNWTVKWQMGYNLVKCKGMRLGSRAAEKEYHLRCPDGSPHKLEMVKKEKDLGVIMDSGLNFEPQINNMVKIANSVLGTIKRTFSTLNRTTFTLLYKSLVRSHLEYGQEIWSPWRKSQMEKLEKVQRRATKLVASIRHLPYKDRLRKLKLPSLGHRRLRGDIILMYKMVRGLLKTSLEIPYSPNPNLRGHSFKLETGRYNTQARRHFFTNRIVGEWNKLPEEVINALTMDQFKSRLDRHWHGTKDIFSF